MNTPMLTICFTLNDFRGKGYGYIFLERNAQHALSRESGFLLWAVVVGLLALTLIEKRPSRLL